MLTFFMGGLFLTLISEATIALPLPSDANFLLLGFAHLAFVASSDKPQTSKAWAAAKPFVNGGVSGMLATCVIWISSRITADEGVLALWKGVGPTIVSAMALNMGMLASYDQSVELFRDFEGATFEMLARDALRLHELAFPSRQLPAKHWDAFYHFYRNTTDNKWGHAYLTREFFHMLGSRMGDRVLLIVAEEEKELIAGALNVIGGDTLFGRLWGCHPKAYYPNLHFETCYYQAIEAAIELGLKKVEAGAQGEHKIQRGYMPTTTYSTHYFPNDMFKQAVQEFLKRESSQVNRAKDYLTESGPFKGQTS
ncbi:hypothetical protein L7F22_040982 [Adiantum nelumboides]|nr:hypothetical protein [Adiantum nelumboides]